MLWWEQLGFTTCFPPFPPSPTASTQLLPACPCAWHPAGTKRPLWRGRMGRGTPMAHCPLSLPSHCSAAGEFFPEAAQVAYRMWELSAVAKVEVSTPQPLLYPPFCSLPAWDPRLLLSAAGHGQPRTSALPLAPQLLSTPFSSFGARGWRDVTPAGLATPPPRAPLTLGVASPACLCNASHAALAPVPARETPAPPGQPTPAPGHGHATGSQGTACSWRHPQKGALGCAEETP